MSTAKASSDCESDDYSNEKLLAGLNRLRLHREFFDVTLKVGDKEFAAHRAVLAVFSPYFKAMFASEFRESRQSSVTINDVDASVMEAILDYVYTGRLKLTESNVFELFHAADLIQSEPLIQRCCNCLENNLTVENCIDAFASTKTFSFAKRYREKVRKFIMRHLGEVSKTGAFLQLERESVIEIIREDDYIEREETVYEAVMQWLRFNEDERFTLFHEVFSHVRLVHVNPEYLIDHVDNDDLIRKLSECCRLVDAAKACLLVPSRMANAKPSRSQVEPNENRDVNALIKEGIILLTRLKEEKKARQSEVIFLCSATGLTHPLCTIDGTKFFGFVSSNNIIVAGMRHKLWTYDLMSRAVNCIPLRTARSNYGLFQFDGFVYVIGGDTGLLAVERCDMRTQSWTSVAPLLVCVCEPAVVTYRGMVYVIGQSTLQGPGLTVVQRYDPTRNEWKVVTKCADVFSHSSYHSEIKPYCAFASNGKIYVMFRSRRGGQDFLTKSVLIYNHDDISDCKRSDLEKPFKSPLPLPGVVSVHRDLFLIGRDSDCLPQVRCFRFNPEAVSLELTHHRKFPIKEKYLITCGIGSVKVSFSKNYGQSQA